MRCPRCGDELDEDNYCCFCKEFFSDDDFEDVGCDSTFGNDDFEDVDYDSIVGNGDEICLNCTFWSVSPYGAAHGMVCRRGYPTSGPGDYCSEFIPESHFASYGDAGQFQFDETGSAISNKLYHWKNNR